MAGNRVGLGTPSGSLSYSYDNDNRLASVSSLGEVLAQTRSDPTKLLSRRWARQCFEGISLVLMEQEKRKEVMEVTGLTEVHLLILGLLGPPYEKYHDSSK